MSDTGDYGYRDGRLPLAEVMAEVAESFRLAEARAQANPEGPIVSWQSAQLEIQAEVTKDAQGRVRVWVVEGGGGVATTQTVKITVDLSPWLGEPLAGGK